MYHKLQYDVWFLRYGVQWTIFVTMGHFLPFYTTNNLQNQNFEKMIHNFTQVYQQSWSYAILFLKYGVQRM